MNVSTQQKDTSVQPSFHFSIFSCWFSVSGNETKGVEGEVEKSTKITVYLQELVNTLLDNMYINIS